MNYLSVCSGIEAATVAWRGMGWNPVAFSEIEKFPSALLAHHFPDLPNWGDMTNFKEWPDANVDILVGGTPCQSFSVAGFRKGLADPRGNLALTYLAIAERYRPEWLVWENVPGVLSSNRGRDFGSFLGALGQLRYGFAYRVLDAQYFGVAQRRRRLFVVANATDWRRAAAVLFERESLSGNPAPSREAREETTGTISSRTSGGGGVGADFECAGGLQPVAATAIRTANTSSNGHGISPEGPAYTLDHSGGGQAVVTMAHGQGGAEIGFNRGPTLTCDHEAPIVCHGTQGPITERNRAHALGRNNGAENALFVSLRGRDGGATADLGGNLAGTLRAATGGGDKPHVMCFAQNSRDEVRLMPYAGALAAEPGMKQTSYVFQERGRENGRELEIGGPVACALTAPSGGGRAQERNILDAPRMAVRRLTPVECERLQGFPEQEKSIDLIIRNGAIVSCTDHPRNYVNAATKCRKLQSSAQRVEESDFPLSVKSVVKGFCVGQASLKEHAVVNVEINYVAGTLLIHKHPGELMFSAKIAESSKENRKATPTGDFAQLSAEAISCVEQTLRDGKGASQKGACNFTKAKNGKPQKEKQESDSRGGVRDVTSEKCPASEVITLTTSQNTSTIRTSDLNLKTLLSCVCHAIDGFTPNLIPNTSSCTIRLTVTDGFTKIPYRNKPADKCPDGPRYKALGNSMAVPVMKWIGERIADVDSMSDNREDAA